jgi:hypothetical protein
VTVVRWGSAVVHDDRTCVADGCTTPQPAETDEVMLPRRAATLRTRATLLRAEADNLDRTAKRLDREHSRIAPTAWLCPSHHGQLRFDESAKLHMAWIGARHDPADVELIEATRQFLSEHPMPNARDERGLPAHPRPRRLAPA